MGDSISNILLLFITFYMIKCFVLIIRSKNYVSLKNDFKKFMLLIFRLFYLYFLVDFALPFIFYCMPYISDFCLSSIKTIYN